MVWIYSMKDNINLLHILDTMTAKTCIYIIFYNYYIKIVIE
jgi:hypothetical protein